jgi:hypothetical protein
MRSVKRPVLTSLLLVAALAATSGAQANGGHRIADAATTAAAPAPDGARAVPVGARHRAPAGVPTSVPARADDTGSSRSHYALVGTFIGFGLAGLILAMDPPTRGMSAAIILPAAAVVGGVAGMVVHALRY